MKKIAELQKRYDDVTAAIKKFYDEMPTFQDAMPSESECYENIYMERNGEIVKNNTCKYDITFASVSYNPCETVYIMNESLHFIRIMQSNQLSPSSIRIPIEAIKPLIKVLEDLI